MECTFRQCAPDDIRTLRNLSCRTYYETFADQNTPSNMKAYLRQAFALDRLRGELSDCCSRFYFLYADGALAGYLKLNEAPSQTDVNDDRSLELERIYVAKEFQGMGLGGVLMNRALMEARERKKAYLWLGVWEKNDRALRFYEKNGFYPIGRHVFVMGDEAQTDYLMRKDLEEPAVCARDA